MESSKNGELPADIQAALEDLHRIREVVDRAHEGHPLRRIARPMMLYTMIAGIASAVFGVTAQLILVSGAESIVGLRPELAVGVLAVLFAVGALIVKNYAITSSSRKIGFDLNVVLRSIFNPSYLRVVLGVFTLVALGIAGLLLNDGGHMVLGLLTVGVGTVWAITPILFPIREFSYLGYSMIVLGALAMFLFPEWTFYKLAVIWGLPLSLGGLILYRRFPKLSAVRTTTSSEDRS